MRSIQQDRTYDTYRGLNDRLKEYERLKRLQKTAVLLAAVILAGAFSSEDIKVEATSSTWQQIQKEQQEKNELQNQLNQENDNLENLKGEQNSLKGQLNNLNGQLTEVSNNLADLEQQIADKEQEIADTQDSLEEAKATEEWQYECMVIRVRDMYERNETSYINAILSAQSFDKLLKTQRIRGKPPADRRGRGKASDREGRAG